MIKRISFLVLLLLASLLLLAGVRHIQRARDDAWRAQATSVLGQVQLAVLNYQAEHGVLPPVCLRAEDGTPLLSWRTLVIPQLLRGPETFGRLDLTAPWNSSRNERVIASTGNSISGYFTRERADNGRACVFAYIDERSRWQLETPVVDVDSANPGVSNRVLLLYVPSKLVPILKPVEIDEDELQNLTRDGKRVLFATLDRTFGEVAFVGGQLRFNEIP